MAFLFQTILDRGAKRFERARNTYSMPTSKDVRDWYRSLIRNTGAEVKNIDNNDIIRQSEQKGLATARLDSSSIGKMYMFAYDPKHKGTLPYYDTFPLVFPIELYGDGFLGINMHYLPPYFRAKLMDALYTTATDKNNSPSTRLNISYKILASAAKFKYFQPTIHRYLWSQCRSHMINVEPKFWDMALMLPSARFQKVPMEKVQQESLSKVK